MSSDPVIEHNDDRMPTPKTSSSPAYAVLYVVDGKFLIATKRKKSYYYMSGTKPWVDWRGFDVPKNKGPGLRALPGGGNDEGDIEKCARREFVEETGVELPKIETTSLIKFEEGKYRYSAAYFRAESEAWASTFNAISSVSLPYSERIVEEIIEKKYTKASEVQAYVKRKNIDVWPKDNELDSFESWNITDRARWDAIKKWKGDEVIGWYYEILKYLRVDILGLKV